MLALDNLVVTAASWRARGEGRGRLKEVYVVELRDRLSVEDPFTADSALEEVQEALGLLVEERLAHWTRQEGLEPAWAGSEAGRDIMSLIEVAIAVAEGVAAMRTLIVSGSGGDVAPAAADLGVEP